MWFAGQFPGSHSLTTGLRGGMSFALALVIPTANADVIVTTTLMIIFFTVLIEGGAVIPLLRVLKISTGEDYSVVVEGASPDDGIFIKLDRNYLKPFFTNLPPPNPRQLGYYGGVELGNDPTPEDE